MLSPRLSRAGGRPAWTRAVGVGITLLFAAGLAAAQDAKDKTSNGDEKPKSTETKTVEPPLPPLTLGECLAIAHDRQPVIRAARHSLRAAEIGYQSLMNLRAFTERVSPDIPVRREQARRGLTLSTAEIQKATQETTQDVTFLYFSYVYAKQSEQTANDVIEQMETYYEVAESIVKSGVRDPKMKINQFTLYALQNLIGEVKQLRVKASTGRQLALTALKEAMGVEPTFAFEPATKELPLMLDGTVSKEQVIADALARRPELAQAAAGVDVFRLEICAQEKVQYGKRVATLASGSDLHTKQVPMAIRNGTYRPGALAPEMPVGLVGNQADRVAHAAELSLRQDVLYEKTVNLVRTEATVAYLNWDAATKRVREAKRRYENGRRLVEDSRAAAVARQDPELLVNTEALAGKAQADYVEAVLEHIKTLAALERVTAGGIYPKFPTR